MGKGTTFLIKTIVLPNDLFDRKKVTISQVRVNGYTMIKIYICPAGLMRLSQKTQTLQLLTSSAQRYPRTRFLLNMINYNRKKVYFCSD